ncbi:Cupredoxin [Martensiomyces pterosporus]|nr:Cupredoxin [Martensiomyces pterosporus]
MKLQLLLLALAASARAAQVSITNLVFVPNPLTISSGSTVTWFNNDNEAHIVVSSSDIFNSGTISPGGTYSFTFADAGTYSYSDVLHPTMTGVIIVTSSP